MTGPYQFGCLFDPQESDPSEALLADAVQRAYKLAKQDRKEAICVWDADGNEIYLFINGQRWRLV